MSTLWPVAGPARSLGGLNTLEGRRFPELALSAYLPTDGPPGSRRYWALLQDLARAEAHKLDGRERNALERELPVLASALDKHRFACPAVAVFSCAPGGLLRMWRLSDAVPGRIAVADWLDLAPIRQQLFERPPALAVVVDKRDAKLFGLVLGELIELAVVQGVPISRHHQGGWSATAYQRREDEHARQNLGHVAETVAGLLEHDGYRSLVLGGPTEARAELKALLPPAARRLVAGEGAVPMRVSHNELAQRLAGLYRGPAVA